ncbi:DUF2071 domain-containing protein [Pseudonocardia sp. TRM90224]|uniref:DUF2071 domain-containing protein n=1 Tax=Pseudonocardia sp. TRM90224 TaxID=2812678 RepID=UPI001E4E4196|nr:DUF2071 domain-containing protein [Pseudonocardia sp. TRM90224]
MTFVGTQRPPRRWFHAETELDHFAIVTYRVETAALAALLPAGFAPREVVFDDGRPGALVSAVAFVDRDFHFRFCPPVAISCGQINYRAYVTAHGRAGVWFFATSLDHVLVGLPRLVWGMPWRRTRIEIDGEWAADAGRWRLTATDRSSTSACEAVETGSESDRLDGFTSRDEWMEFLTHPTSGWYGRRSGGVGEYSIWHPPMTPRLLAARSARFALFEQLGLVDADSVPHSVLAQPSLHFDIHTPPRRYPVPRR